jgi:hypothetical protein
VAEMMQFLLFLLATYEALMGVEKDNKKKCVAKDQDNQKFNMLRGKSQSLRRVNPIEANECRACHLYLCGGSAVPTVA